MQLIIKGPLKNNVQGLMRSIGYYFIGSNDREWNSIRPMAGGLGYPRFHLYLKIEGTDLVLNLHLDQKKPSYGGTASHGGEYDGPAVESEAERIKQLLKILK
ncbi:MAG: hypothetical protein V1705_00840 [bacterium]